MEMYMTFDIHFLLYLEHKILVLIFFLNVTI